MKNGGVSSRAIAKQLACHHSIITRLEGRKVLLHLMMHSTQFILWLCGLRYIVKDHSYSERENLLLSPHGLFLISSKGPCMHYPTDRIVHTTAFVTKLKTSSQNQCTYNNRVTNRNPHLVFLIMFKRIIILL